jgi:hypothetical protein
LSKSLDSATDPAKYAKNAVLIANQADGKRLTCRLPGKSRVTAVNGQIRAKSKALERPKKPFSP